MSAARDRLFAHLAELGIETETIEHPPVFTVEEAARHTGHLPGAHTKNLFLEDREGGLWLVVCRAEQPLRINALARLLGAPRMSFGKPERLAEVLGVVPGAVTPFALLEDRERRVRVVLDAGLMTMDPLNFHPLDNAATTSIRRRDFLRFLDSLGYRPEIVDLARTLKGRPPA